MHQWWSHIPWQQGTEDPEQIDAEALGEGPDQTSKMPTWYDWTALFGCNGIQLMFKLHIVAYSVHSSYSVAYSVHTQFILNSFLQKPLKSCNVQGFLPRAALCAVFARAAYGALMRKAACREMAVRWTSLSILVGGLFWCLRIDESFTNSADIKHGLRYMILIDIDIIIKYTYADDMQEKHNKRVCPTLSNMVFHRKNMHLAVCTQGAGDRASGFLGQAAKSYAGTWEDEDHTEATRLVPRASKDGFKNIGCNNVTYISILGCMHSSFPEILDFHFLWFSIMTWWSSFLFPANATGAFSIATQWDCCFKIDILNRPV